MHIRILITGDDPMTLIADSTLLKDRGMYVYTASSLDNISELVAEIRPDVIFFDTENIYQAAHSAYNNMVCNTSFKNIPVVYTLTEDEVYLVTRDRTGAAKKSYRAASVIDAVKVALKTPSSPQKHVEPQHASHQKTKQLQLALHAA